MGLALVVGACGKHQEVSVGDPTPARLGAAAQAMAEAGTGTYSGTVKATVSGPAVSYDAPEGAEATVTMALSGSYDIAGERTGAHVEVTSIEGDARALGQGFIVGDTFDTVTDHGVAYERSTTGGVVDLHDGMEWHQRPPSPTGGEVLVPGIDVDTFAVDPDGLFEQLQALSNSIEDLGSVAVQDVEARHYHAAVSMEKVAELNESERGSQVYGFGSPDSFSGITLPVDVFVDSRGLVRRYVTELDYAGLIRHAIESEDNPAVSSPMYAPDDFVFLIRFELDFAGIGEPVTIDLPDDDSVATEPGATFEAVGEAVDDPRGSTSGTAMTGGTIEPDEELLTVYQAVEYVPRGTPLEQALAEGMVTVAEIPADFAPDSALDPDDEPTGVALFDLAPGTIVVKDMFIADSSPHGP